MFESVKICWVSSHLTNTFTQLRLPIKTTPNIRGVDLDFETLEEKNEMASNLRGVICNLLFNLNLSAYPQE